MSLRLVLASASPRRAEILTRLALAHTVRVPETPETVFPGELPAVAARRLAVAKAKSVRAEPAELLIAADTIVALDGEPLGKPAHPAEATETLMRLSGREHHVFTGLALRTGSRTESGVARTAVRFRQLARVECEEYVASGEPADKAGAYGIQGRGAALVEGIDGDFFNVMGLPVQLLLQLLGRHGYRYDFKATVPVSPAPDERR
ncbi:MAG: Maf family protein [marine benthic group bacterium]|jgi:septum formation protein|nr:Maf family protein [Gemmatimonadota bacterium]MCL7961539.1 Maf family protein [Candidatus Carthagonibacter metallireducens]MCL7937068.1 Maf family protein [Gemmatimonadota bacterium]MCL7957999.1 Maf family protein [Gemmatimonadota bacterium]MCL7976028.1 Maf family protein [Gemmatimonadota bacterium]